MSEDNGSGGGKPRIAGALSGGGEGVAPCRTGLGDRPGDGRPAGDRSGRRVLLRGQRAQGGARVEVQVVPDLGARRVGPRERVAPARVSDDPRPTARSSSIQPGVPGHDPALGPVLRARDHPVVLDLRLGEHDLVPHAHTQMLEH